MERPESVMSRVFVSESSGSVSTLLMVPHDPIAVMTLAHGAGTDMHHSFMHELATRLASSGVATMRFNFPYTERGRRMPDRPAVATATVAAVAAEVKMLLPSLPLFLAGKSFGGRMSSHFAHNLSDEAVRGLIFYGFPLHPADKPSVERASHLPNVSFPMLFLQGTKDTLAYPELIEQVVNSLSEATLISIEKADHAFKSGKRVLTDVLAEETVSWIKKHA